MLVGKTNASAEMLRVTTHGCDHGFSVGNAASRGVSLRRSVRTAQAAERDGPAVLVDQAETRSRLIEGSRRTIGRFGEDRVGAGVQSRRRHGDRTQKDDAYRTAIGVMLLGSVPTPP